jgi:hypothetical protein
MVQYNDAFSGRANISLRLTVTETPSSSTNRSTISWTLQAVETASQPSYLYDPVATASLTFTFDSTVSGQSLVSGYDMTPSIPNWEYDFSASGNQTKTLGTGSFIVNHNTLGQGKIKVTATANDPAGNLGSATITTQTITLTDFSILAVAANPSLDRSGTDIVVSRPTPTTSTGGSQTFVTWLSKNGEAATNIGTTTPITVTSLSTDYASAYVVSSFDGNTATSSTVNIYGVPFAPTAPTISNVVTTSLTLTWTAPGNNGSAITGYVIEASTDDGGTWTAIDTTGTSTTRNLTNLTIAATYTFRIIAVNGIGASAPSSASVSQFISAYGYRFTSGTTKVAIKTAARYTGISTDVVTVEGTDYTGWKLMPNVLKYQNGAWVPLET